MAKRGSEDVPQSSRKSLRQDSGSYNSPAPQGPLPEGFRLEGTLQDLDLNPDTLTQQFPQLREGQQMHDLYEVVMYNGVQRHPIEASYQEWRNCRVPKDHEFYMKLIDYPLEHITVASHMTTPPNRIVRAIVTYHDIRSQAESQSLKALAIEASKKLTDYVLLYLISRTPRAALERTIPHYIQWFEEALRTIQDSLKQTSESDSIAQGQPSSPGSCPSLARAAEPAGPGEENTASLSEAVDAMLFKPEENVPDLEDIALDPTVHKAVLSSICMPLMLPEAYGRKKIKGILLHGMPGCGKSLILESAAKQYGLTLFDVDVASVFSKWQGDSEKFMKHLFQRAIKTQPSVIFIDEVDSMMAVRSSNDSASINHVKSIVFKLWQDLHDGPHQVVIVGATTNPEMIDSAFLRRFDHRIHIKLPSLEAKSKILKLHLRGERHTLKPSDIHELVHDKDLMKDISGDDIVTAITSAQSKLLPELIRSETWERLTENGEEIIMPAVPTDDNKDNIIRCSWINFSASDKELLRPRHMTKQDLVKAFRDRKSSYDAKDIMKHLKWAQAHGTCH